MRDAWRGDFAHGTTWLELQRNIDEYIHTSLVTFLETLLADPDLSDPVRARAWATAAPLIRRETRRVFEQAWHELQLDALPTSGPVQ